MILRLKGFASVCYFTEASQKISVCHEVLIDICLDKRFLSVDLGRRGKHVIESLKV